VRLKRPIERLKLERQQDQQSSLFEFFDLVSRTNAQ
jgi:hypothetical protein